MMQNEAPFPYLDETQRFRFPRISQKSHKSVIAWGGNLSPGMLLSAYEQGLFPWYNAGEPILWHSPDPRFVIFPEKLHVSESMRKILRRKKFTITMDSCFGEVIQNCGAIKRPDQEGTWINHDIIQAYMELNRLGWAHSAEARIPSSGDLAGGCYGIRLGKAFFGESMFSREPNASKAAFLTLAKFLFESGVTFIDCQVHTVHLESLGGIEISREEFLRLLQETLAPRYEKTITQAARDTMDARGSWGPMYTR